MNFDLSTIQEYLSTIQLHLDNFVNTQEGWYKILSGVTEIFSGKNLENAGDEIKDAINPLS